MTSRRRAPAASLLSLLVVAHAAGCSQECPPDALPDASPAADGEKVVFVTSTQHSGALGGLAGADAICTARAAEAGLAGTFKAWLSISGDSAAGRLTHADVPYVRTDGARVADGWSDLVDGSLAVPIELDEAGASTTDDVWTGTLPNGTASATTCNAYTDGSLDTAALCGSSNAFDTMWTASAEARCHVELRLYCVQQ